MKSILLFLSLSSLLSAASWSDELKQAGRLEQSGENAAAEKVYEQVLTNAKDLSAAQLNALGMELYRSARYRDAERVDRQSLDSWDRLGAPGKDHALTLVARNELGDVLRAEHRYSESERLSRETLGPLEKSLGDQDPRVIRALANYSRLVEETRKIAKR